MKVTISEVSDVRDAVMASGLSLWIEGMGIRVEAPPVPANLSMQRVVDPAAPTTVIPAPIAEKRCKTAVEPAGPSVTTKRTYKKREPAPAKTAAPAKAAPVKKAEPFIAHAGEINEPPSQRDCVREAVRSGINTTDAILAHLNKTYPHATGNTLSAILGQLSAKGEIEMDENRHWGWAA